MIFWREEDWREEEPYVSIETFPLTTVEELFKQMGSRDGAYFAGAIVPCFEQKCFTLVPVIPELLAILEKALQEATTDVIAEIVADGEVN